MTDADKLQLTRRERERIGIILRDAAGDQDGEDDAVTGEAIWRLAAKVDPWHDRDGNPIAKGA
jgi:hypothetical protein